MRWMAAALLALTLAGCAAPEEPDPLFGRCPAWVQAPGEHPGRHDGGNGTQLVQPQNLTYLGRPFDLVRLRLDALAVDGAAAGTAGTVELRAYASGNGTRGVLRTWRDFRGATPQAVPVLVLDAAAVGHEFEAALTSLAQEDPPRPGPLELAWTVPAGATAHVAYTLTFHHKVCGLQA